MKKFKAEKVREVKTKAWRRRWEEGDVIICERCGKEVERGQSRRDKKEWAWYCEECWRGNKS